MPISLTAPEGFAALAAPLRTLVTKVLHHEYRRVGEIGLVLARDPQLRILNREWRGIDRATDVISFAYDEHELDAATRPVGGDLVFSLDRVAKQAKRFRVSVGAEFARLVIHGALHLCGHDHKDEHERLLMRKREDAALGRSGAIVKAFDGVFARVARAVPVRAGKSTARVRKPARAVKSRAAAQAPARPPAKRAASASAKKRTAKKRTAKQRAAKQRTAIPPRVARKRDAARRSR